jgi:hypothetical protein
VAEPATKSIEPLSENAFSSGVVSHARVTSEAEHRKWKESPGSGAPQGLDLNESGKERF